MRKNIAFLGLTQQSPYVSASQQQTYLPGIDLKPSAKASRHFIARKSCSTAGDVYHGETTESHSAKSSRHDTTPHQVKLETILAINHDAPQENRAAVNETGEIPSIQIQVAKIFECSS